MTSPSDHINPGQPGPADTEPFSRPLRPGQVIAGRYQIEEMIARGGQALVYKAKQEVLNRPVALKVMSMSGHGVDTNEQTFRERFQLEARTLATLDHPHIVRIHDYGPVGAGSFYFAMEFIDGDPMSKVIRQEGLSRGEALGLMTQVMNALHYAHRSGVVHRDMKFTNVLIHHNAAGERTAKVVDFGIAKVHDTGDHLTQRGDVLGSPHFMSPEQIAGDCIDNRTDIYSVGIMLYRILTGAYPFRANSAQGILAGHLMRTPTPMNDLCGDSPVPAPLEEAILRCLEKKAVDRFNEITDVIRAIEPFISDTTLVRNVETQAPQPTDEASTQGDLYTLAEDSPTRESMPGVQWMLLGAIGVLILTVLGLTAYVVYLGTQESDSATADVAESVEESQTKSKPESSPESNPATSRREPNNRLDSQSVHPPDSSPSDAFDEGPSPPVEPDPSDQRTESSTATMPSIPSGPSKQTPSTSAKPATNSPSGSSHSPTDSDTMSGSQSTPVNMSESKTQPPTPNGSNPTQEEGMDNQIDLIDGLKPVEF